MCQEIHSELTQKISKKNATYIKFKDIRHTDCKASVTGEKHHLQRYSIKILSMITIVLLSHIYILWPIVTLEILLIDTMKTLNPLLDLMDSLPNI